MRVVSTFNPAEWGNFVKRNILSWLKNTTFELVVYHEGAQPGLEHPNLVWRQWEEIPGAQEFVDEAARFPPARGRFKTGYDYNFDAWKFCRKVYAQCDASEEDTDYLLWLDSDVEITHPMLSTVLETLISGMPLARYERRGFHTETGVVLWHMEQQVCQDFFRGYRALYDNRRIYCLPRGWHDCWALDYVVDKLAMPTTNLGRGGDFSSPHAHLDVVTGSELGHYLRHDKGMRKHAA